MITVSGGNKINVYNTASNHLEYTIYNGIRGIRFVTFSPDSKRFLASSIKETVKV